MHETIELLLERWFWNLNEMESGEGMSTEHNDLCLDVLLDSFNLIHNKLIYNTC